MSTPKIAERIDPVQQIPPVTTCQGPSVKVKMARKPQHQSHYSKVKVNSRKNPVSGFLEPDTSPKLLCEHGILRSAVHVSA